MFRLAERVSAKMVSNEYKKEGKFDAVGMLRDVNNVAAIFVILLVKKVRWTLTHHHKKRMRYREMASEVAKASTTSSSFIFTEAYWRRTGETNSE